MFWMRGSGKRFWKKRPHPVKLLLQFFEFYLFFLELFFIINQSKTVIKKK